MMKNGRILTPFMFLILPVCIAAQTTGTLTGAGFRHPGVLVNRAQLEEIKSGINSGLRKQAFDRMKESRSASLDYTPRPRAVVECGAYSNPNRGCSDERQDALAAYTHALMWYLTDNAAHAEKSIEIMNAWAATLREGHIGHNARLQAGWAGCLWPAAGELIRHTYDGWAERDVAQFIAMLKSQYVDKISESATCTNGNWELIMIEAMANIAVFSDDRVLFDRALERWRARVPAYMYLTSDGPTPVPPPDCGHRGEALVKYWHGQTTYVDGLGQETCRDFGHMLWGVAASVHTAETALQQGVDLYAEEERRIIAALEFHAKYLLGEPIPQWLGGGRLNLRGRMPMWEMAFNHFHNRLGRELPSTEKYLMESGVRPTGTSHFFGWETLTHAEMGWIGIEKPADSHAAKISEK